MGSVQFGIPRQLALGLRGRHGITCFVETGTLVGDTSLWASTHFDEVWTIELDTDMFNKSKERLSWAKNIRTVFGESSAWLRTMRPNKPILFWLDAHTNERCPVLAEIAAINRSPLAHVILVDDARLFGGEPEALPDWPTKDAVISALTTKRKRTVRVFEDVLVAEPCR